MGYDWRMKFAQDQVNSKYLVEAYESGCIRVGSTEFRQNLLLMPDKVLDIWELQSLQDLSAADVARLADHAPDIILIGSGEQQLFPHPSLFAPLMQAGIGYEVMPTHAACRTYNILLAEDRRVLAALIV
jgi:uncharacterized protein